MPLQINRLKLVFVKQVPAIDSLDCFPHMLMSSPSTKLSFMVSQQATKEIPNSQAMLDGPLAPLGTKENPQFPTMLFV